MKNVDDFLAAIGYGGISLAKIAPRIKIDYVKMFRTSEAEKAAQALPKLVQKKSKVSSGVIVEGLDQLSGQVCPVRNRCPAMRSSGSSPGVRVCPSTSWTAPMSSIR